MFDVKIREEHVEDVEGEYTPGEYYHCREIYAQGSVIKMIVEDKNKDFHIESADHFISVAGTLTRIIEE